MFKKKPHAIDPNSTDTLIGEGSIFEGRIKSEASLRVEGQITGDIDCAGDVTIGERGVAKSNIIARNVTIAGQVHGNINTKGTVTITASGHLYGNMTAQSIIIAEGGVFQGSSKMQSNAEKQEKEPSVQQQQQQQPHGHTQPSPQHQPFGGTYSA